MVSSAKTVLASKVSSFLNVSKARVRCSSKSARAFELAFSCESSVLFSRRVGKSKILGS